MLVKDAIKHLQDSYDSEETICLIVWSKVDVHIHNKDMGRPPISDEDAEAIVDTLESNHDATMGITWDSIEYLLFDF
jgi:hypothetical protein